MGLVFQFDEDIFSQLGEVLFYQVDNLDILLEVKVLELGGGNDGEFCNPAVG